MSETLPAGEHSTVEGQNALRAKVAALRGDSQHVWSKSPGDVPCIGFMPQCQACMIRADERGANDACIMSYSPDYPYDLDACAIFEKELTDAEHKEYRIAVWRQITGRFDTIQRNYFSATAEQRYRAFVATMEGKKK